jgi:hypothetical protein
VPKAAALIPSESRNMVTAASLDVALAAGPTQRILRPVEIEASTLSDFTRWQQWPEAVFPLSDVVRIIVAAADTTVQALSIGPHVGDAAFHTL